MRVGAIGVANRVHIRNVATVRSAIAIGRWSAAKLWDTDSPKVPSEEVKLVGARRACVGAGVGAILLRCESTPVCSKSNQPVTTGDTDSLLNEVDVERYGVVRRGDAAQPNLQQQNISLEVVKDWRQTLHGRQPWYLLEGLAVRRAPCITEMAGQGCNHQKYTCSPS